MMNVYLNWYHEVLLKCIQFLLKSGRTEETPHEILQCPQLFCYSFLMGYEILFV